MSTRAKAALAALLLLAALLRFGGLSHDLHEGRVYHPDTAKQIHAVQRFVAGEYYRHIGNKDYDGYPLLHAHLAEYFIRVAEPVRSGVLALLGVPARPDALLDEFALYWILLLMNALLSTAMVLVVFLAGRESFGPAVGWVAAVLLALSPADITAAHMATGDVTTAFFAALSLLFALRVFRLGRHRDYAWAAAAATFAFAAKYYAATAFFTIAAAHLARAGRPAAWFARDSLKRIGTAAAVAVGALFLADPALLADFRGELADIHTAMTESTLRFPKELVGAGAWERFVYSMTINLPDFVRSITPVAVLAVLLAVVTRLRRDARVWVLLVGPVLYLLLAVGSRALVNPVYHAAVTPPLFLLTAFCFTAAWREGFPRARAARLLSAGALAVAGALLARDASREVWFALQMDTRRAAEAWIHENVPLSFRDKTSRYTLEWYWRDAPGAAPQGTLFASSGLAPLRIPAGAVPLKEFALERAPLTQFRNVGQRVAVGATELLRPGFALPALPRWPSQAGNRFVFDNGAEFLRSEKQFILDPGRALARRVVTQRPLAEAWVAVRSVTLPAEVRVRFGGRSATVRVESPAGAVVRVAEPRPGWPTRDGLFFYALAVDAPAARTRVALATTRLEAGRALYALGRHAEAYPLLAAAALEARDPAAAAQAIVSAAAAGTAPAPGERERLAGVAGGVAAVRDDDALFAVYGIRSAYLDALPFLRLAPGELGSNGFRAATPPFPPGAEGGPRELLATVNRRARPRGDAFGVWTGPLLLDPGSYRGELLVRSASGAGREQSLTLLVSDERGAALAERRLAIPPLDGRAYATVPFALEMPAGAAAISLRFTFAEPPDIAVGGLEVRPDVLAGAAALGEAVGAALAGVPPPADVKPSGQ